MKILKFGGSSVADADNIRKVSAIIKKASKSEQIFVVVSALGGTTDLLLNCGALASEKNPKYLDLFNEFKNRHLSLLNDLGMKNEGDPTLTILNAKCTAIEDLCKGIFLLGEFSAKTKDLLVSNGEWLSSKIISESLKKDGIENEWKDAREFIITDSNFNNAVVDFNLTDQKIKNHFSTQQTPVFIIPGFIASDKNGATTTLGRGGSDYTAAIIAAALHADLLEIWTDVTGLMTADPRLVPNAKEIPEISYQEAMELSHFGAKVIYPPTIQPVMGKRIPIQIKNTFFPEEHGTLIKADNVQNGNIVRGISSINKIVLLTLEGSGMVGIPGFSKRLFEALANEKINVIIITQSSSEHSICVGIEERFSQKAKQAVDECFSNEILLKKVDPLKFEEDLSIVALVGESMRSHPGISGRMFSVMGKNGINIRAIAQGSSERNISAVITTNDVRKAINVLHEEFFETTYKQVNLFLAGVGNVGGKLMRQLQTQQQYLKDHLRLNVRVIGIANSKKAVLNEEGIDLNNWQQALDNAESSTTEEYLQNIISRNMRNSIFVDITANASVAAIYEKLLFKSIAVVACNKIACSSEYLNYQKLKSLSREYNASFLFDTNVGAGLPIISTLNDLLRSGDNINRMEAVLSGTLNFVFNNYDGTRNFAEVVKQAQDEGYTEPDPRLDLSGTDVMRKIMILARESGEKMEMTDIENNSFMPESCMVGSVENFYKEMEKNETHFKQLYEEAAAKNCKLKFVAKYENGKASGGLKHIPADHDFYNLMGKDNVVLFFTDRYVEQPLVVKGAGAGADVTASGVFADIIRAARI